jgi:ATP-dependent helicase/nuclease subunit A
MEENINQLNASDPSNSVWVFASAGTGKTKILVDRFLRLILSGSEISKIICITFTKAAANEMLERIIDKLSMWSIISDDELYQSIFQITNQIPSGLEQNKARSFYDQITKSNIDINIQTIHSLCQNILLRFPIEASINSNFTILDQSMMDFIISEIKNEIFFKSNEESFILENLHDLQIMDLIKDIVNNHIKFRNFFAKYFDKDEYKEFLIKFCNAKTLDKNLIYKKLNELKSLYPFDKNIKLLKNDEKIINNYNNFILLDSSAKSDTTISQIKSDIWIFGTRSENLLDEGAHHRQKNSYGSFKNEKWYGKFNELKYSFLNKDGSKKKKLLSNNIIENSPELYLQLTEIRDLLYQIDQDLKNISFIEFSLAFYDFAKNIIEMFEILKNEKQALTYDELIDKTVFLLNNSDMKDWILYKLDGGFDHILIDEAQDTSPLQWEIIKSLIDEFFSGQSSNIKKRSLFVVGDDKQSIYSFQGANVKNYLSIKKFLKDKIISSENSFSEILLKKSYRSSKAIIKSIDYIMNYIKLNYPNNADFTYNILDINKENDFGQVEIWPISTKEEKNEELNWPLPSEILESNNSYRALCYQIADFIKSEINSGRSSFEDFMILVRKRDNFISELIKILEEQNIKNSGLDRIDLKQNLSIMDLISLAKFIILPNDDLNLAGLLLSPIIGLDDEALLTLSLGRKSSIWQRVCEDKLELYYQLMDFIDLYKKTGFVEFFIIILEAMDFRQKLNYHNGNESDDAINEFIKLVKNYSQNQKPSLQDFVFWFETSDLLFIRENKSIDSVKISTIHGAKGLESKIVILIDSGILPANQNKIFFDDNDNIFFPGKASNISDNMNEILKNNDQDFDEYLRLLYVAISRAKQKLIICGYSNSKPHEDSWYNICYNSLLNHSDLEEKKLIIKDGIEINDEIKIAPYQEKLDYLKNELNPNKWALQSSKIQNDFNQDALEYGTIFHKIMQYIVKNINISPNKSWINNLPEKFRSKIESKINLLNESLEFHKLKQEYKLYTEISFIFEGKIGRLDLLAVNDSEVIIIDYKTDVRVPDNLTEINPNYIDQIEFYKSAIKKLYPDKKIISKILWLENMIFMKLE